MFSCLPHYELGDGPSDGPGDGPRDGPHDGLGEKIANNNSDGAAQKADSGRERSAEPRV